MSSKKVAIVCDWITGMGGAERLLLALHKTFPDAPIFTSTYEPDKWNLLKGADIRTSWLQKIPGPLRKHQLLTVPRQWYFGSLKLKGYDVVVSAGGAEAKAVRAPDGVHIDICYTPTLYYWIKPEEYFKKDSFGIFSPMLKLALKLFMGRAKRWDFNAAQRPDKILAISSAVQDRIKEHYHRDADILYPPADIERFANSYNGERAGFVVFGRNVHHKRIDLAIAACNLAKVPLVVIGDGPEHESLKQMAGPTITFQPNVSDAEMVSFVSKAKAFIFPNEEDFGIVAVEAQAAGIPVIAYRAGGALDTVIEGVTGEFFNRQTPEDIAKILGTFDEKKYSQSTIVANARKFSRQAFEENIKKIVEKA